MTRPEPALLARPPFAGERISPEELLRRDARLREQRLEARERVDGFAHRQEELEQGLDVELREFVEVGRALDEVETLEQRTGFVGTMLRRFSERRIVLQRRSLTEGLIERYEVVTRRLQRASAFSDELRLCALELQAEVDALHGDLVRDVGNETLAAERVLDLDRELEALSAEEGEYADLTPARRARLADRLAFRQRSTALELSLYESAVELGTQGLKPARRLRDHMLQLHEEMARYVLRCGAVVREAGQRIQALGAAADAPLVVSELRAGIHELEEAVRATEAHIERTRELYSRVVPVLDDPEFRRALRLPDPTASITRVEARDRAEHALEAAAAAELAELLGES